MSKAPWRTAAIFGVLNVRQAAEYYRDVLGFHLDPVNGVFQPTADEPGGVYAIVERAGSGYERELYLYVDDVDALHAEFQQSGAKIVHAPRIAPYGIREMEVEDLNGYRLTFGQIE